MCYYELYELKNHLLSTKNSVSAIIDVIKELDKRKEEYIDRTETHQQSKLKDEQMEKIMYQAMGDYLDTCDKPSAFIYLMANLSDFDNPRISIAEQIALAFMWVQVRNKHTYINGFKQEFFDNRK